MAPAVAQAFLPARAGREARPTFLALQRYFGNRTLEAVMSVRICSLIAALFLATASAWAQGVITSVAGRTVIFTGDGGPAKDAPLGRLARVVLDSAGNVFALDFDNSLLVKVSATGVLSVLAGNGFPGFPAMGDRPAPPG